MFENIALPSPKKQVSLYIESSLIQRIREEARRAGIPVSTAVQTLLEAGIKAIENNNTQGE